MVIRFAPELVGTYQDSEGGGERHGSSPSINCARFEGGLERDFFFARPSATSCLVGQPLALGGPDRAIGAFAILNTEGGSVAVPEVKLGEVAVKMLLADVEVTTVNAAFQEREKAFDGIGMRHDAVNELARPFFLAVVHGVMTRKVSPDATIGMQLVSHQPAFRIDATKDHIAESGGGNVLGLLGSSPTATLDERNDGDAISAGAAAPAMLWVEEPSRAALLVDGVGFVRLDDLAFAAEWATTTFVHRQPDAMHQKPCGFHAPAQSALYPAGRDAFFARANQVDRLKPNMQRNVARFENRPHPHRKRLPARPTLPQTPARAFAPQSRGLIDRAAMRAHRAIRPKLRLDVCDRGFFVAEMRRVKSGFHGGFPSLPPFYPLGRVCQV